MVEIYSIASIVFGLFFIAISFVKLKHQTISQNTFVIWILIGVSVLIFGIMPITIETIQNILGTQLSISAVVVTSFAILFLLVFYLHQKVDFLNQQIIKLIAEMAANKFYNNPENDKDQK